MRVPIVGYILMALIAYLLGSIPTGFLVAKARGVDIRTRGQRQYRGDECVPHPGQAGGRVRAAGRCRQGLAGRVRRGEVDGRTGFTPRPARWRSEWFALCAGVAAILGHNYTCWLHFKGGKGIATSAGVLVALVPVPLLIILGVWIVVFALSRYVSLASICAAFALPFAVWLFGESSDHYPRHRRAGGAGDLQAQGQHPAADQGHGEPNWREEGRQPSDAPKPTA